MLTLLGGPAAGAYAVKRAPLYLRAVVDKKGKRDVLDQLDDTPRPDERVYVYRLATEPSVVIVCGRGIKGSSGVFANASYLPYPDVDGEKLRETDTWREWCTQERERDRERLGLAPDD